MFLNLSSIQFENDIELLNNGKFVSPINFYSSLLPVLGTLHLPIVCSKRYYTINNTILLQCI